VSAYVIVQEDIKDEATFDQYRKQVVPTITSHGGKFIVRGGKFTVVEGSWPMPRLVVIEFPSRAAAEGWYHSPEYQKILPLRLKSGTGNLVIADGL
jgi:uncharacterized protein (DUF1330 family)